MRRLLQIAAAGLALIALTPAAHAATAPTQHTLLDVRATHVPDKMTVLAFNSPANWSSPVNYSGGRAYLRLQIHSKPSTKVVVGQYCMWRDEGTVKYKYETCANPVARFTQPGVYYVDMGVPSTWWKMNGVWDFTKAPNHVRIMMKDANTGKLLMSKWCGIHCYTGGDLSQHVPIQFSASVILVAKGARLNPPASYQGCPSTWSTECPVPT